MNANEDVAPRAGRRRLWVFAPILLSLAALVVAGVLLTRDDDDPGYQGLPVELPPQPDLHWTMDPMPDGWVAAGGVDAVPQGYVLDRVLTGNFDMTAYGTSDDPTKPALVLAVGDEMIAAEGDLRSGATEVREVDVNGVVGLCAVGGFSVQRCLVTKDGTKVESRSRGFTVDELLAALGAITLDFDAPTIPVAALPSGVSMLAKWHNQAPGALSAVHEGAVGAWASFGGADGKASLTVGRDDQQELALAFEQGELSARELDGITYYEGVYMPDVLRIVSWEHEGFAFQMVVTGASEIDLVQLARAVRPATADEWATAVTATAPPLDLHGQDPASDTTFPPPVTEGPDAASIFEVRVTTRVDVLADGGGLVLHTALPGGPDVPLRVVKTDDTLAVSLDDQPFVVTEIAGATLPLLDTVQTAKWSGTYVLTSDARAATLRVQRANGDRYAVDLVPVPDGGGLKAAYVSVPAGERWNAEVVDQFDVRLDFLGLEVT